MEMIDEYLAKITEYKAENEIVLWDILIQQLNQAKRNFGSYDPYSRQTIGCLGTMRGISGDDRVFSNALQRQFSEQLSQNVNQLYNYQPEIDEMDEMDDLVELPNFPPLGLTRS